MKSLSGAVLVAALLVGTASFAAADTLVVEDPRDADFMDIDVVTHGHDDTPSRLVHTITTYRRWSDEQFLSASFLFWLDDGDRGVDRTLTVFQQGDGSLVAIMEEGRHGQVRGTGDAYLSGRRTLVTEFNENLLGPNVSGYEWKALLSSTCPQEEGGPVCTPPPPDRTMRVAHAL